MTIKLSPSSLNLFLDCPRCFWLQIIKKIKRPSGAFPSLPSGMDKILKIHFDNFMKKGELPPELKREYCVNGCSLFDDVNLLKIWRSNLKGIQYLDKESGAILHGAIDNLLVKGKKFIVLDYKTRGFPLKEDTHKSYQSQMNIYNFLLRENGYQTEDFTYLLFYYPNHVTENGEVIFDTKLIKISTNPENGKEIFKKAIKLLQEKEPPRTSESCEFCEWKKN